MIDRKECIKALDYLIGHKEALTAYQRFSEDFAKEAIRSADIAIIAVKTLLIAGCLIENCADCPKNEEEKVCAMFPDKVDEIRRIHEQKGARMDGDG